MAGDTDNESTEDQRRNNGLNQPQEYLAQDLAFYRRVRKVVAKDPADNRAD
jgi:hypothetical protein